jgi:hypothetical protein
VKLTRAARTIITEDSGALLHRCVTELEKDKDVLSIMVSKIMSLKTGGVAWVVCWQHSDYQWLVLTDAR